MAHTHDKIGAPDSALGMRAVGRAADAGFNRSLRLGEVQPGLMPCIDIAHGAPDSAIALEARAESNLPYPVATFHALRRLNACQHVPACTMPWSHMKSMAASDVLPIAQTTR